MRYLRKFVFCQQVKGSILIIFIAILVVLSLLVTACARRLFYELEFLRYEKEKMKARYLAKAGINWTIEKLKEDTNNVDYLGEFWVDDRDIFEKKLGDGNFSVKYKSLEDKEVLFGVYDEDRKININKADENTLFILFNDHEVVENIRLWRGDKDLKESFWDSQTIGYPPKKDYFSIPEELLLVEGVTEEMYKEIKDLITLWSDKVNINTASEKVVYILVKTSAEEVGCDEETEVRDLVERIFNFREDRGYFETIELDKVLELTTSQVKIVNKLKEKIKVKSRFFHICSFGYLEGGLSYKIEAVWDKDKDSIVYWNEG